MTSPTGKSKSKKRWPWLILAAVVVIVVAFVVIRGVRSRANAASQYQTTTAQRGSLKAMVGATGTVRARQTAILTWQTTGAIGTVNVQPGDQVKAGDVLASLESTSLPQNVIMAQADLVSAQKALNDLMQSNTAQAQAWVNLVNAQNAYNNAVANNNNVTAQRADRITIDDLQAKYTLAENTFEAAQKRYYSMLDHPITDLGRANAETAFFAAKQARDTALANLTWFTGKPTQLEIDKSIAAVALAKAQLDDAQREYNRLKNGPDPNDIKAAQARVDSAQAAVDLALIGAPFNGTVTEVTGLVGDQVTPGTKAFRLDDLSRMQVDVQVSEVDINRVQVGQPVGLTFDAIPDKAYNGKVVDVAQAGDVLQGAVNFTVTVELTDADAQVKPGMTAAVNIVVNQLDNVLLVPNRAVRLINNQQVVYVLRNGQPQEIQITLGASSDTDSQVVAGDLKVGDEIILNPPSTLFNRPNGGGGGGARGIFGGGG